MRLLHTADWHLGKRLFGVDRLQEARAALGALASLATSENVDATIIAGDMLDRRLVDSPAFGVCLEALERLAEVGPVVAIAGNHDDPDLWQNLAPYLAARGVHVAGRIMAAEHAVRSIETAAGPLHVALVPWLDPARMGLAVETAVQAAKGTYADDVAGIIRECADGLRRRRRDEGGAAVLVGHVMVDRAIAGGGERELTMGLTYAISPAALPADLDYVALGHVHRPQPIPGFASPGRYCGSPMALDFSEDNHAKSACIVEISAEQTISREIPLTAARPLVRLRGPLTGLAERAAEHPGAWFLCQVELESAEIDLVRKVREVVPDALRVEAFYPQTVAEERHTTSDAVARRSLPELYADWHQEVGRPLDPHVVAAFEQALAGAHDDETST